METNYKEIADKLNQKLNQRNSYWFYGQIRPLLAPLSRIIKTKDIQQLKFEKVDLSLGKMQTLALEFFYDLDPDLEEMIGNVLEDVKNTTVFVGKPQEKSGRNSVGAKDCKIEISLHPKNDTMGIVTVAHEFGHTSSQRIQSKIKEKTDCIGEIESVFIEKIFADWLLKKGVISKDEREKMTIAWQNDFIWHARIICEEAYLLDRLKRPITAESLQNLEKQLEEEKRFGWLEILKHRIDIMINGDRFGKQPHGEYEFRYIVGEIVAQALYEDFKKDPKQTIERYKNYLSHNSEYEFFKKKKCKRDDGKVVENYVLDKSELDKCFVPLLGEDYKQKLTRSLNDLEQTKTA